MSVAVDLKPVPCDSCCGRRKGRPRNAPLPIPDHWRRWGICSIQIAFLPDVSWSEGVYAAFRLPASASSGPSNAISDVWYRAERRLNQVCGQLEYEKVFDRLDKLPVGVDHLILQLGTHAWSLT
jgi:hypothetical protein